jgi:hypothetical protein
MSSSAWELTHARDTELQSIYEIASYHLVISQGTFKEKFTSLKMFVFALAFFKKA